MLCKSDIQTVDGAIMAHSTPRVLKAWLRIRELAEGQNPTDNSAMVPCPTCGAACRIYSSNEGTNSFEPVTPYRAQHQ